MSTITVTRNGESTSPIIWVGMTPWTRSAILVHVEVPGGDGLGETFSKGSDNAVTTLRGRVPWTAAGQMAVEKLAGSRVTVTNGIDGRTGIAGTPTPTGDNPGWIYFTIPVTEVRR